MGKSSMSCVRCGQPAQMFWLNDEVWDRIRKKHNGKEDGFILCFKCAQELLGELLTLRDLALSHYLKTVFMPRGFLQECVRSTLHGAYQAADVPPPEGWRAPCEQPFTDAFEIGTTLGKQTLNVQDELVELLNEYKKCFSK